ncbi:MAG: FkbM family methyltransferase [Deltaproteobacteria bacterium]|nr:FkbM family methyltransferase [Deltaproteobacteria bacterium]
MSHADFDQILEVPGVGPIHFDSRSREELLFLVDEIFTKGEYARNGVTYAPGSVIVDVGANIGLFILDAHRRTGGDCDILAIEPIPENLRHLHANLDAHGIGRIEVVPVGLTRLGGPSSATFSWFPGLPANSTQFPEEKARELSDYVEARLGQLRRENPLGHALTADWVRSQLAVKQRPESLEVPLATLARLREEREIERIDLLKIDVEGAELEVLQGIDELTWAAVSQIVLETDVARADEIAEELRLRGFLRVFVETPEFARELLLSNRQVIGLR